MFRKLLLPLSLICLCLLATTKLNAQYHITSAIVFEDTSCNGHVRINVKTNMYGAGQTVETSWGNATTTISYIGAGAGGIGNSSDQGTYSASGSYTVKTVLIDNSQRVDSMVQTFQYHGCSKTYIRIYNDINHNCLNDIGDLPAGIAVGMEVDSNNVVLADTMWVYCGVNFIHYGPPGTVYTYKIISLPQGYVLNCPATGIVHDTITGVNQGISEYTFGVICTNMPAFDLAEQVSVSAGVPGARMHIDLTTTGCNGQNATLKLNFSPKLHFNFGHPSPNSVVGHVATWNLPVSDTWPQSIYVDLVDTPAVLLTMGDTLHNSFYLTPTAGDTDISNNVIIRVDTVKASFDPNYKEVKPNGDISAGTELTYTIHFENTGNDTARNIYVLDTLSDYLLPNTFKVISSTAVVMTSVTPYGAGHSFIKFDFPNIMLPDSSHHGLNDGMVVFKIKTKPGIANGTYIPNRAGIYFDNNPAVMTEYAMKRIGIPQSVQVLNSLSEVMLYPNPVTDILNIYTDANVYGSLEISNALGQVLMQQPLKQNDVKVNVKTLPAGVYMMTLKGRDGKHTLKFEKL